MATATYTKAGTKATTPAKLDKAVFGIEVKNHELLKAAYTAYLANGRINLATTKKRGEVRGSNIKPWRQKGTGRARFGSRYNPIWRGGGIVFGPSGNENYSKQLNTQAKRTAIRQALSLKSENVAVIEDLAAKSGKTADLAKLLQKIGAERTVLLVVEQKTPELLRAARNLPGVQVVGARFVNVYDVMNADRVVFSQAALKVTTDWLTGNAEVARSSKEAK
ncbi:MAG TPA: 50S ribosomal protein L4 [Candidatus Saccharimonadales bacterium]|jgi:large subunit ribosomal protein L4|nr:50S ribosomal protein L4 [Candidatus Saccharimonadales bacterium]